jgi:hypothetical protein
MYLEYFVTCISLNCEGSAYEYTHTSPGNMAIVDLISPVLAKEYFPIVAYCVALASFCGEYTSLLPRFLHVPMGLRGSQH